MKERSDNKFFCYLTAMIILIGAVLRILFFSYGRPFWNDESALALNLLDRSFSGLFLPLKFEQVTPPFYSGICKLFGYIVEKKEFAFRLPSLICGILSLPVFCLLAKNFLKNNISIVFAAILFALNYRIIYYCAELKQYSCDVLLFLAILLSVFYVDFLKDDKKSLWLVGIFYAVSLWFSYTSLFAIITVFVYVLLKKNNKMLFSVFLLPALSTVSIFVLQRRFMTDENLHTFWTDGFLTKDFSNFGHLIINNLNFYFSDSLTKVMFSTMFIAGCIVIFKNMKSLKNYLLIVPLILAVVLSYLHIYPLYMRTALYLYPLLVIILAESFEVNFFYKKSGVFLALFVLLYMSFTICQTDIVNIIKKQYYKESTPELLNILKGYVVESQDENVLVVPNTSIINYEYYSRGLEKSLKGLNVYYLRYPLYSFEEIQNALKNLPPNKTVNILFTHSGDKSVEFQSLSKYVMMKKSPLIISDDYDNALMRYKK